MYGIDNLVEEALAWYDVQKHKPLNDNSLGMIELVKQITLFPAVRKAILIALTLPATSCTVERSFGTLRRVKTWLRSTMSDTRMSGLCMLSVHRDKVNSQKTELMKGHWQFRKRSPTAPIPDPSVIACSNWMNCWEMFMLFYSFSIFPSNYFKFLIFQGGQMLPCPSLRTPMLTYSSICLHLHSYKKKIRGRERWSHQEIVTS